MRDELPFDLKGCGARALTNKGQADVSRLETCWIQLRARNFGTGGFLFGKRSIADIFYLPVALRLRAYEIPLGEVAADYVQLLLDDPDFQVWKQQALEETLPYGHA